MKNLVTQLFNKSTKTDDKYNVLYMPYDGCFAMCFDKTNINLYSDKNYCVYEWNYQQSPLKLNWLGNITNENIDVIIANHKYYHKEAAYKLSKYLHVPIIFVDHEMPNNDNKAAIHYVNNSMPKATYVTAYTDIKNAWMYNGNVIPYGIEKQNKKDKTNDLLLIENTIPEQIKIGKFSSTLYDDCDIKELVNRMIESKVCVIMQNNIDLLTLIALSCGCSIVTNNSQISDILQKNYDNVYVFDNINKIEQTSKKALDEYDYPNLDAFYNLHNVEKFKARWNVILKHVIKDTYKQ